MTYFKIFSLFLLASFLTACGVGTSTDPGNSPLTDTTTINSFTVTGSGPAVAGKIPLNPAINNGAFTVDWNIDSSDPYHVDLYMSSDNQLNRLSDDQLLTRNCGSTSLVYNCSKTAHIDCSFNSSNVLACGTASDQMVVKGRDLTAYLDTIPKTSWLLIEACNALMSSCKTSAVEIEFQ